MTRIVLTPEQMTRQEIELTREQQDCVLETYADANPGEDDLRCLAAAMARVIGDMAVAETNGFLGTSSWRDRQDAIDGLLHFVRSEVEDYLTEHLGNHAANENHRK